MGTTRNSHPEGFKKDHVIQLYIAPRYNSAIKRNVMEGKIIAAVVYNDEVKFGYQ